MRWLRAVAALLACSLLLPLAAPCAAWAMSSSSSTLPCCAASPAKGGGCEPTALTSIGAGCCSTARGEAQRPVPGIDRPAALALLAAMPVPAATAHVAPPTEAARCPARPGAQHDILRL
jgi:hypothetical protein